MVSVSPSKRLADLYFCNYMVDIILWYYSMLLYTCYHCNSNVLWRTFIPTRVPQGFVARGTLEWWYFLCFFQFIEVWNSLLFILYSLFFIYSLLFIYSLFIYSLFILYYLFFKFFIFFSFILYFLVKIRN